MDLVLRRLTWHWTNGFGFDFRSDALERVPSFLSSPSILLWSAFCRAAGIWVCFLGSFDLLLIGQLSSGAFLADFVLLRVLLWLFVEAAGSYQAGGPGPSSATVRRIKTNIPTAWVAFYTQVLPFIPWLSSNTATIKVFASGGKLELSELFNFQVANKYIT